MTPAEELHDKKTFLNSHQILKAIHKQIDQIESKYRALRVNVETSDLSEKDKNNLLALISARCDKATDRFHIAEDVIGEIILLVE